MNELALSIACDTRGRTIASTPDGRTLTAGCTGNEGFAATELLLAALGGCIHASLVPLLARHGHAYERLRITAAGAPAAAIAVHVALPRVDDAMLARCRRAAASCPVLRALRVPVNLHWEMH